MPTQPHVFVVLVIVLASVASAQGQAPLINPTGANAAEPVRAGAQGRAISPDSSVDEVLTALDARGRNLREFVADVKLVEIDEATQLESERTGRVWYQKQNDDDRIRVLFDKKAEGKFLKNEK